jgi:small-conductance mechanosensitive channel
MSKLPPSICRRAAFWLRAVLPLCLSVLLGGALVCARPATVWAADPAPIDRSTPRRAVAGFLEATDQKDDVRAAKYLDLRSIPRSKRAEEGPILARKLRSIFDWKLRLNLDKISDAKEGDPTDGPGTDALGTVELGQETVTLAVSRVELDEGGLAWLVSRGTISHVPELDPAEHTRPLTSHLPRWMSAYSFRSLAIWQWLGLALIGLVAYVLAVVLGGLVGALARRLFLPDSPEGGPSPLRSLKSPARLVLFIGTADLLVDELYLPLRATQFFDYLLTTIFVGGFAWLLNRATFVGTETLSNRLADDTVGELRSRGVRTQLVIMRKIGALLVWLVAVAIVLLQFPVVRTVGYSLLASAGLAGVVLGFAAQKSLGGIIAGIQLSLTQPLRIGDVVMTEGEWGTVEELTLTYVVIRVWDQRRLVVPIARFLEHPFQNWTKTSSDINGTVVLFADYDTPVDQLRVELRRICEEHPLWDGKTCVLQVTDMAEKSLEIRALVSATDAFRAWDLRCDVRERMIVFLRQLEGGIYLPRLRSTVVDPAAMAALTAAEKPAESGEATGGEATGGEESVDETGDKPRS